MSEETAETSAPAETAETTAVDAEVSTAETPAEPIEETPAVAETETTEDAPVEADTTESDDASTAEVADEASAEDTTEATADEAADADEESLDTIVDEGTADEGTDDDEFSSAWDALGQLFVEDRDAARAVLAELAGVEVPTITPKSPAEAINELFAAREAEAARKQAEALITIEIRDLGYEIAPEPGTKAASDLNVLRSFIGAQPAGQRDVKAAHEAAVAYKQSIKDEFLEELRAAGKGLPPVATGTGSASPAAPAEQKAVGDEDPYEKTVRLYAEKHSAANPPLNG